MIDLVLARVVVSCERYLYLYVLYFSFVQYELGGDRLYVSASVPPARHINFVSDDPIKDMGIFRFVQQS